MWGTGLVASGMWHLSEPGTELVSLALQSRFLTIEPPGSLVFTFNGSTGHHIKATSPRNEPIESMCSDCFLSESTPNFFLLLVLIFFLVLKLPLLRSAPLKSNILQLCEQSYSHIHTNYTLYKLFIFHCGHTFPEQITIPLGLCLRIFYQYTN